MSSIQNLAPLIKCITKIVGTTEDDSEDLVWAMAMYNLIEYSSNYSETTGSLKFYSKDEATDFDNAIANTDSFKSFIYKSNIIIN